MKKIFALLIACALVFSMIFTMSSCFLFESGEETPEETPNETPDEKPGDDNNTDDNNNGNNGENNGENNGNNNGDNNGDDSGIGSEIIENVQNGGVIELPIVDVNSQDKTQPEGGESTEEGTTEEGSN